MCDSDAHLGEGIYMIRWELQTSERRYERSQIQGRTDGKLPAQSANDAPHASRILPGEDAESVMLNLVYPAGSGRRFSCRRWFQKSTPPHSQERLGHPVQHRADVVFRYAPILAFAPLFVLVMDGFAEPFDGMPYTDGLGREVYHHHLISPGRVARRCTFRAVPFACPRPSAWMEFSPTEPAIGARVSKTSGPRVCSGQGSALP
jgi:hypothetical protein